MGGDVCCPRAPNSRTRRSRQINQRFRAAITSALARTGNAGLLAANHRRDKPGDGAMRWGELTALGAKASARGAEVDILIDACHSGDAHLLQQLTVALSNYTDDIDPSWLDVLDRTSSYLLTARAETLQQLADAALRESAVS